MYTPLFVVPEQEKSASMEVLVLGRDPNRWVEEIYQKLLTDHPYLNDFNMDPVVDRAAPDAGLMFMRFLVRSRVPTMQGGQPVPTAIIPIIVVNRQMKPIDIFGAEGTWMPLTEGRIREVFGTAIGTPTKLPDLRDQAMIGMAPSSAGGVDQLPGEFKASSILLAISDTVEPSQIDEFERTAVHTGLLKAAVTNSVLKGAIAVIGGYDRTDHSDAMAKIASESIEPTAIQVRAVRSGNSVKYYIKEASAAAYQPIVREISGMEFSELPNSVKEAVVLYGYSTHVVPVEQPDDSIAGLEVIEKSACEADVFVRGGGRQSGVVLPLFSPVDGSLSTLFVNQAGYDIQEKIAAVKTAEIGLVGHGYEPRGLGVFVTDCNGVPVAIGPMDVRRTTVFRETGEVKMSCVLPGGIPAETQLLDGLKSGYLSVMDNGILLLPKSAAFLPLPDNRVQVESNPGILKSAVASDFNRVRVTSNGTHWTIEGDAVAAIPRFEKEGVDRAQASFVLGVVGLPVSRIEEVLDKQSSVVTVPFEVQSIDALEEWGKAVAQMHKEAFERIRKPDLASLLKVAQTVDGPQTVDSLLALGFINPQNVQVFISHLPVLDESVKKMCELLLAARIGLRLDEQQLRFGVQALENVIQDLKHIANESVGAEQGFIPSEPEIEHGMPGPPPAAAMPVGQQGMPEQAMPAGQQGAPGQPTQ